MADINIIPDDNIQEIEVDNAPYQEIVVEQEVIQSIDVYQEQSQTVDIEPTECTGGIALDETCPLKADLEAAVNSKIPKRIGEKLPQAQSLSNMDKLYIESQSNEAQFATLSQLVDFISSGGTGGGGGTDAVRGISSIEKTASAGLVDTYTIYFTDETTQTYTVTNGESVSIVSVITSPSDDGYNIITFSDGSTLTVKNGSKGSRGERGLDGEQGPTGEQGPAGNDYVITEEDYDAIATEAAKKIDIPSSADNGLQMPQIRFGSAIYTNAGKIVNEENPLKLRVEIVGGGALQVGDRVQICAKRTYGYKDVNGMPYRKQKLRQQCGYEITEEDLDKRFLTISTDSVVDGWLFKNDRNSTIGGGGEINTLSAFYLRIKRPIYKQVGGDTVEVDAIFSNVITVWKTYNFNTNQVSIK